MDHVPPERTGAQALRLWLRRSSTGYKPCIKPRLLHHVLALADCTDMNGMADGPSQIHMPAAIVRPIQHFFQMH